MEYVEKIQARDGSYNWLPSHDMTEYYRIVEPDRPRGQLGIQSF